LCQADAKAIVYEKESAEAKHIAALQLGCYAQSQLAQHSVNGVLAKVTPDQWIAGVYVLFEAAVSRVFFETFATTLHGKAGGVNVLVNASQRMLAVQLIEKGKKNDDKKDAKTGHILIKVATDGRFVITNTPAQPNAAAAGAPASTPATMTATTATVGGVAVAALPPSPPTLSNAASGATATTTVAHVHVASAATVTAAASSFAHAAASTPTRSPVSASTATAMQTTNPEANPR
jgi:hypothetical protein